MGRAQIIMHRSDVVVVTCFCLAYLASAQSGEPTVQSEHVRVSRRLQQSALVINPEDPVPATVDDLINDPTGKQHLLVSRGKLNYRSRSLWSICTDHTRTLSSRAAGHVVYLAECEDDMRGIRRAWFPLPVGNGLRCNAESSSRGHFAAVREVAVHVVSLLQRPLHLRSHCCIGPRRCVHASARTLHFKQSNQLHISTSVAALQLITATDQPATSCSYTTSHSMRHIHVLTTAFSVVRCSNQW